MPRRVRVVTARNETPAPQIIMTDTNPRVPRLSENEIQARRLYLTSTTMGFRNRSASSMDLESINNMTRQAGFGGMRTADTIDSGTAQFYSPQLSTDFLEKPQNLRERRAFYRFFYNTNEIVGAAVDLHSSLPLSKLRLVPPKGKNKHQNEYVYKFFTDMCDNMKLFKTLIDISHEYTLFGNSFCFTEESDWQEELTLDEISKKKSEALQRSQLLKDKYGIVDKNPLFKGWKKILVLPPDQVRVRKLPLTDDVAIEYMPDPDTRRFLTSDIPIDPTDPTKKVKYSISQELRDKVRQTGMIPLD